MPRKVHPTPFVIKPALTEQMPQLQRFSRQLSQKYAGGVAVMEEELKAVGSFLWDALKIQNDFDAAQTAAGNAILPVIVESGVSDAQVLPWEILHHPVHGFWGATRLSR